MGSIKKFALAGAFATVAATNAFAGDLPPPSVGIPEAPVEAGYAGDESGVYLRGDVGAAMNVESDFAVRDNTGSTAGIDINGSSAGSSFIAGAGIGYAWNSWLRFDVTGEYRGGATLSGEDDYNIGGNTGYNLYKGDWSSAVGMLNAYVDVGTICALGCITPYIGGGVGYAYHWIDSVHDMGFTGAGAPTAGTGSADGGSFAWAVMAGLAYKVNDKLTMDLGYRYMNFGDLPDVTIANVVNGNDGGEVEWGGVQSHDIRLGMRWTLSGADCCTPAEPPTLMRKY